MSDDWNNGDTDWLDAIAIADEGGPLTPLIDRLRSNTPMSKQAREWLADLLKRRQLKKRPGGQARAPWDFDLSDAEMRLRWAEWDYERSRDAGLNHDAAIKKAAELTVSGKIKTLQNYLDGRRGVSRRR